MSMELIYGMDPLWIRKAGITRQTEVIYDPAQLSLAIGALKAG